MTSTLTAMFNLHRCRPPYFTRFVPPPHPERILPQNKPGINFYILYYIILIILYYILYYIILYYIILYYIILYYIILGTCFGLH